MSKLRTVLVLAATLALAAPVHAQTQKQQASDLLAQCGRYQGLLTQMLGDTGDSYSTSMQDQIALDDVYVALQPFLSAADAATAANLWENILAYQANAREALLQEDADTNKFNTQYGTAQADYKAENYGTCVTDCNTALNTAGAASWDYLSFGQYSASWRSNRNQLWAMLYLYAGNG
jgi:hypothetical protein